MPELPEVETVRRAMERHLSHKHIVRVWCSGKRLREPLSKARLQQLIGDQFTSIVRRAKYLLLELRSGNTLLVHLGMTGNLLFRAQRQLHDHVVFHLDDGPPLVFADTRRFGIVAVCSPSEVESCPYLRGLGIEPLSRAFDADHLRLFCKDRKRPIKNLLLDGRIVAGLGNIYVNEALFQAGIRPSTRAERLSRRRLEILVKEIKAVLRRAIRRGGTTISDYLGSGSGGRFQQELAVYGRAGESCFVCDSPVKRVSLSGRSSFYCARCQK